MKRWKISEAKARLSEVVGHCAEEPQVLYNRKKPVAALVDMEEYEAFLAYKQSQKKPTMAELLDELDEIKQQEPGEFDLPPRASRPVPYLEEWVDRIARRAGTIRAELAGNGQTREQPDMLIAATAWAHDLILSTRNTKDFEGTGIALFNPFEG